MTKNTHTNYCECRNRHDVYRLLALLLLLLLLCTVVGIAIATGIDWTQIFVVEETPGHCPLLDARSAVCLIVVGLRRAVIVAAETKEKKESYVL
jgi:hypothetical protein